MVFIMLKIEGDQKVPVHLMNTIQKTGAQRLFDHPVYYNYVKLLIYTLSQSMKTLDSV